MSPVSTGSSTALSVDYRYILTDTLTDNIIAELPFVDVSYSTALNQAGSFSGSFPITPETIVSEIYENTIPGKTSLYVLRNGVCVWGGIISSRSYDVKEKILDVTADEFVSYLDRRVLWKTVDTVFPCEIEIFEDTVNNRIIGKVTLTGDDTHEDFNLVDGKSKVRLYFGPNDKYLAYTLNSPYTVLDDSFNLYQTDTINYKFFYFAGYYKPKGAKNFRAMQPATISSTQATVQFRLDTDDYLDILLNNHFSDDVKDLTFVDDFVAPGNVVRLEIDSYSRDANGVATITVVNPDSTPAVTENYEHFLVPGQIISIESLPNFNDSFLPVLSANSNEKTFTYQSSGSVVSNTSATTASVGVIRFIRESNIVTIVTQSNHGLSVGQLVEIEGVDPRIDSEVFYRVTRLGTSVDTANTLTKFQFSSFGEDIDVSVTNPSTAKIYKTPYVEFYTGGSFTENSDIGISFTTPQDLLTTLSYQDTIRGAEVFTFKEIIDKYTRQTDLIGFDYRIQCTFTPNGARLFSKEFKFLPLIPESLETAIASLPGGVLPDSELPDISYFEIDGRNAADISFEFPGNILSVSMEETLEEGATRVFAQGKSDLDPPPYAAAADHTFLRTGDDGRRWPLYDKVIKKDKVYYNNDLQEIANKVLSQAQLPVATFSMTINGSLNPQVGTYYPGDWCVVYINDPFIEERLASYFEIKGDTSRTVLLRKINKISVQLSNNPVLPEEVTLELVTEPGVDMTGEERRWR